MPDSVSWSDSGAPCVFLMGPTAAGKTALAAALVRRLPFEIISVDSAMVYRGMDIGTGKPGPELLALAPHRLIDIRTPDRPYSVAEFRTDALTAICEIRRAGRVPLLVGGTGLYFRALRDGLAELPAADDAVRARISSDAAVHGWQSLHDRLAGVDPVSAARIHPNDPQRIQRALEVYELTGRSMSEGIAEAAGARLPFRVCELALWPRERERLHARIESRFGSMLERGLVDELCRLRRSYNLTSELPSMRAVGYRQVWEFIEGYADRQTMTERAIHATRQLAKRQLTWLRGQPSAVRFDAEDPTLLDAMVKHLRGVVW